MNKLMNYLKAVFVKVNSIYIIVGLLLTYILTRFSIFIKNYNAIEMNFYDFFIEILGNYSSIVYFITFTFVLLIYNIGNKNIFYQYILLKFKNKKQWFYTNVFTLLFVCFLFTSVVLIFAILVSILPLKFDNHWSDYSIYLSKFMVNYSDKNIINVFQFIISNISPITFMLITLVYILMYLLTLGLIYLILSLLFKKKIFNILGLITTIILNLGLYCSQSILLKKLSFFYNIILIDPYNTNLNFFLFYSRFLYWVLIIFILVCCGTIIISRLDSNYEEITK